MGQTTLQGGEMGSEGTRGSWRLAKVGRWVGALAGRGSDRAACSHRRRPRGYRFS